MAKLSITVYLVNESAHKPSTETFNATAVNVTEDGGVTITTATGSAHYPATTWGHVDIERVPGRRDAEYPRK